MPGPAETCPEAKPCSSRTWVSVAATPSSCSAACTPCSEHFPIPPAAVTARVKTACHERLNRPFSGACASSAFAANTIPHSRGRGAGQPTRQRRHKHHPSHAQRPDRTPDRTTPQAAGRTQGSCSKRCPLGALDTAWQRRWGTSQLRGDVHRRSRYVSP